MELPAWALLGPSSSAVRLVEGRGGETVSAVGWVERLAWALLGPFTVVRGGGMLSAVGWVKLPAWALLDSSSLMVRLADGRRGAAGPEVFRGGSPA